MFEFLFKVFGSFIYCFRLIPYSFSLILILLSGADRVYAEPYLAIKAGVKCSSCHVNITGGGKRNNFGSIYGQTTASALPPVSLWTVDPDNRFSFGADLRSNIEATEIPNQTNQFAFELEEVLLYAEVSLLKEQLSLYLDQRVAPGGALNREAFGLYKSKRGYYAKAGQFFLPYGFRLEDDTAFIRQITGFNFNNPDRGVEVGIDAAKFSANLALSNGTPGASETDRGKQVSFRSSYVETDWRFGGSLSFNDADTAETTAGGLFAGLRTGFIQWLGEFALVNTDLQSGPEVDQLALLLETNIGWRKGHNIKLTYEHLDSDRDIDENEQNRISALYEFFPIQFVQLTGGVRLNEGIPQADDQNTDEAFFQMHLYF